MSPTMETGNIGSWKLKEGDSFEGGTVMLNIETDKALMDVEASDDGILAKILVADGTKDVRVNTVIAMLAEEGDDISNIELPLPSEAEQKEPAKEPAKEAQETSPEPEQRDATHSSHHFTFRHTQFPSAMRLIDEFGIQDAETKITGTGRHGMLTKGDVLAYAGKIKNPFGTAKATSTKVSDFSLPSSGPSGQSKPVKPEADLSARERRDMMLQGMVELGKARPKLLDIASFERLVNAYVKAGLHKNTKRTEKEELDEVFTKLLR
ncbi:dihydrolipoyllysine-residue acetyltransferase [Malassezia vespertilionis]|uniref:Uncharacterized protein n=1 Tax=Malassezia vespertilionis TaxID=2020962 RepID=A0A2N1JBX4_9BASI|nr:dihydrolipoyllysine-residue acetyltransferase [Malassezia vespertilionis]PKI84048.1 hypothetical protein MVES_001900 [Malassezia vespertilionis]WFD06654.1 dihydrolipoyllysine-residue acetyltransferase [Malassezia vespertilionis]